MCIRDSSSIGSYVTRTGNSHSLTLQVVAVVAEHFSGKVQQAVTGGLGASQRTTKIQALTSQAALEGASDSLILAEHVTDLSAAYADIPCGNVGIRANILVQLCHKALAECHDLTIRFAFRVKVGTTFTAADGQACQGILKDLLKAQEFDDTNVYGGMKTQAALVRTNGTCLLYTSRCV